MCCCILASRANSHHRPSSLHQLRPALCSNSSPLPAVVRAVAVHVACRVPKTHRTCAERHRCLLYAFCSVCCGTCYAAVGAGELIACILEGVSLQRSCNKHPDNSCNVTLNLSEVGLHDCRQLGVSDKETPSRSRRNRAFWYN